MRGLPQFEHRSHKVISRGRFARRLGIVVLLWCGAAAVGLLIGMAGYMLTEGMTAVDAYINAAMILSGMGPVSELKTTAGKLFAGSYAIFSGLFLIIGAGFILAPIFHRVLHRFHMEEGRD
jgi:uncharacterized membrane protein